MPKPCAITEHNPLTPAQETIARDVLERLSGKWVFWVFYVLADARRPMRFARIVESVEGVSQKVLTRVLRQLEHDGFLSRTVYAEVPPRVEYELTDLGKDLLVQITPLFTWIVHKVDAFAAARMRSGKRSADRHSVA